MKLNDGPLPHTIPSYETLTGRSTSSALELELELPIVTSQYVSQQTVPPVAKSSREYTLARFSCDSLRPRHVEDTFGADSKKEVFMDLSVSTLSGRTAAVRVDQEPFLRLHASGRSLPEPYLQILEVVRDSKLLERFDVDMTARMTDVQEQIRSVSGRWYEEKNRDIHSGAGAGVNLALPLLLMTDEIEKSAKLLDKRFPEPILG